HTPRFDRRGFPVTTRDRAERFDRLRSRAVTTTVVATVVAAPLLALWAAYRGAPLADGGPGGASVSASERRDPGGPYGSPQGDGGRTGGTGASRDGSGLRIDVDGAEGRGAPSSGTDRPGGAGGEGPPRVEDGTGPGRLTVEAQPSGDATVVTLTASGGSPVHWTASVNASWLRLDRTHGTLRPGESAAFAVTVDRSREPAGAWTARISIAPAKAVITLQGHGAEAPAEPRPSEPPAPEPTPEPPAPEPTPEPPSSTPPPEPSPPPAGQPD
ncbi:BACON domain-containing protein, partial [Streptomyces atacamensis]|uniref:BACON domain-containing protein n=1 Tax=Streptomyces atacamensis TaxID=531966 RepID=UPI00399C9E0B